MFWKKNKKQQPVPIVNQSTPQQPMSSSFNDTKGRSLKEALFIAINALEQDIFPYNWKEQFSCNCGIVVRAILNSSAKETAHLFAEAKANVIPIDEYDNHKTWKSISQKSCSITGMPLTAVFKILGKHGFLPSDIVHLEYMTNPAILQISGIDTSKKDYFTDRENLIKYFKAWLKIITTEEKDLRLQDKFLLEAKLLIATSADNFEEAAKLKDQISLM